MVIRPGEEMDEFSITLVRKELENIQEGLRVAPHPKSPWSLDIERKITQALEANRAYRNGVW